MRVCERELVPETGPQYVVSVSAPNQRLTALLGDRRAAE